MPIFVPKDLWRWLIGPHTLRQMEFLHHPSHANSTEPPPEPLAATSSNRKGIGKDVMQGKLMTYLEGPLTSY